MVGGRANLSCQLVAGRKEPQRAPRLGTRFIAQPTLQARSRRPCSVRPSRSCLTHTPSSSLFVSVHLSLPQLDPSSTQLIPAHRHFPASMAPSRRAASSHGAAAHSRQLPGAACESCRRRKLRCKMRPVASSRAPTSGTRVKHGCANLRENDKNNPGDRRRPQCGTCASAGTICEVSGTRLARGPKKGDLKALRSRIGESTASPLLARNVSEGL